MSQRVGAFTFNPNDVIGSGSSSVVFKGKFMQRDVAIKRVDRSKTKIIRSEVELLQRSDQHANIIRLFASAQDDRHEFIALELCLCTLKEYVTRRDLSNRILVKTVIGQMLSGLGHLHSLSIIHRDIKPSNVLLMEDAAKQLVVKISDFGYAKQMEVSGSQMSVVPDDSFYWKVPEMRQRRYNMKSDVYSMGCLIFYLLRNGNISVSNELIDFKWMNFEIRTCDDASSYHLMRVMTYNNSEQRPTISCVLGHPFFWENQKILTFLVKVADRIKDGDGSEAKRVLEERAEEVIGGSWLSKLEPEIERSLIYRSSRHGYNGGRICELLRALRNKEAHYDEMGESAKRIFGPLPDGFTDYWKNKFPHLLPYVYLQIYRSGLYTEENFAQFYPRKQDCQALFGN